MTENKPPRLISSDDETKDTSIPVKAQDTSSDDSTFDMAKEREKYEAERYLASQVKPKSGPSDKKNKRAQYKVREKRRDKREAAVSRSLRNTVAEMQGQRDKEREEQAEEAEPYGIGFCNLSCLEALFRKFRTTDLSEYGSPVLGGEVQYEFSGCGLWFTKWDSLGYFESQNDKGKPVRIIVQSFPYGLNTGELWLGPKLYNDTTPIVVAEGCTLDERVERLHRKVGIFDQRIFSYNLDGNSLLELCATDDLAIYRILETDPDSHIPIQCHTFSRSRFEALYIERDFYDLNSSLVCSKNQYLVWTDTEAAKVCLNRSMPFTLDTLYKKTVSANSGYLWAQGPTYMPLELRWGILAQAQQASRTTQEIMVMSGIYSEDSLFNLAHSLPARVHHFASAILKWTGPGLYRGAQIVKEVGDQALAMLSEVNFFPPEGPNDDPEDNFDGDDDNFDQESMFQTAYEIGNEAWDCMTRDFFALKRRCESLQPEVIVEQATTTLTGVLSYAAGGILSQMAPREHKENFEARMKESFTLGHDVSSTTFMAGTESFVPQTYIEIKGNYVSYWDLPEQIPDLIAEAKQDKTLNNRITWKKAKLISSLEFEVNVQFVRVYPYIIYPWPIYKPLRCKGMNAAAAFMRLYERPKFNYRNVSRGYKGKNLPTVELMEAIKYDFMDPITVVSFDASFLADEVGRKRSFVNMNSSSRARRMVQATEHEAMISRDQVEKVFMKTDEYLTAAKPRIIFDSLFSNFVNVRAELQAMARSSACCYRKVLDNWVNVGRVKQKISVTFTYGGSMTPLEKTKWKKDCMAHPLFSELHYDVLVGGDDILVLAFSLGKPIGELESDVSKCDKSQSLDTYKIFCLAVGTLFGNDHQEFCEGVGENMCMETDLFHTEPMLHTGAGETTWFNSLTVGWGTVVGLLTEKGVLVAGNVLESYVTGTKIATAYEKWMNTLGFEVKAQWQKPGCGTFHKGFWTERNIWVPLPSRLVKFGNLSISSHDYTVDIHMKHIAEVARGWMSMPLEPIFKSLIFRFHNYALLRNYKPMAENWKVEAWQEHDWEQENRDEISIEECSTFYLHHYNLNHEEAEELTLFLATSVVVDMGVKLDHPSLRKIYVRDYRCDVQKEFDDWMTAQTREQ